MSAARYWKIYRFGVMRANSERVIFNLELGYIGWRWRGVWRAISISRDQPYRLLSIRKNETMWDFGWLHYTRRVR